ncbi:hypothetical protein FSP39_024886 [Pinctada imbricata]|uniref:Fibrinogen C-terminal domain-containing protein n=1 Tax=Pinctada imbricata TaxID=66713 RepID=A0AA88XUN1_PINIB|nr:hypothetical protein FSP39_024886 [Pinctada imbricata]
MHVCSNAMTIIILGILNTFPWKQVIGEDVSTPKISPGPTTSVNVVDSDVGTLRNMVMELTEKVRVLTEQQDKNREYLQELDTRTVQNYHTITTSTANEIQIKEHVTEIKTKLQGIDDNVDDLMLQVGQIKLGQGEIKTDLAGCGKMKDNLRRSIRKMERKLDKKIVNLNSTVENMVTSVKAYRKDLKSLESNVLVMNEKLNNNSRKAEGRDNIYQSMALKYKTDDFERNQVQNDVSGDSTEGSGELDQEGYLYPAGPSGPDVEMGSGSDFPIDKSHKYYLKIQDFIQEIKVRDLEISGLHDLYFDLEDQMERMESRLTSIQLGHFMEKLQQSLVNFTQNVITLDQWRTASADIVNSTQLNQQQIQGLTRMILNNTNHLSDLEWKVTNVNSLSYQQFNVLRMHVIQLNNTVQDIKEDLQKRKKVQGHHHQNHHRNNLGNHLPPQTNLDVILSRLDDIGLQIVFNENRISKLEIQILNRTLSECQKFNNDRHQDDRILFLERNKRTLEEKIAKTNEIIKRLDHGVYRVYSMARNHTDMLSTVFKDLGRFATYVPLIISSQGEIDNFRLHLPTDCAPYFIQGNRESGVYVIHPFNASQSVRVSCDMSGESGGWTIIHRRSTGDVDFSRDWEDYVQGFGSVTGEHWLGLRLIHLLTSYRQYSLRIEMVDIMGEFWVAEYDSFVIHGESKNFRLEVNGYHGNGTDGLGYASGMGFSTQDRDNDASSTHCAMYYLAGWWYKHCHYGNLNGRYDLGMVWYNFEKDEWVQLKAAVMKIRPFKST